MSCPKSALKKLFDMLDLDDSKGLSQVEVNKFLQRFSPDLKDQERADEVVSYFSNDKDGNKVLSFDEFYIAYTSKDNKDISDADLKKVFDSFDQDGSGALEKQEVITLLMTKKNFSEQQAIACMTGMDKDKNDKLDFNEFKKCFRS